MMGYSIGTWQGASANWVNYTWSYNVKTELASAILGLISDVESLIKQEIYNNGPVVALFEMYDDFVSYGGG